MLIGHPFIWVTDCYAAQFLLSYDGGNQAVKRVDMVHQANDYLIDADYWSQLRANLCCNLTFKDYIGLVMTLRLQSMLPSDLLMLLQNMPQYKGSHIKINPLKPAVNDDNHHKSLAYSILHSHSAESTHVSNCPIKFGIFDKSSFS